MHTTFYELVVGGGRYHLDFWVEHLYGSAGSECLGWLLIKSMGTVVCILTNLWMIYF